MNQISPIGEGAHKRNGEPIARRLADSRLVLHVMRQVRESITLRHAALIGNRFIAAGKGNRLEREERNDSGIIQRKLDNVADLLVVDSVYDGSHRNDVHSSVVQVVNGLHLHIEQVPDLAMLIGGITDSIEL